MRRINGLRWILALALAAVLMVCFGCGKAEEAPAQTDDFNVRVWLAVEANAMAFEYIAVPVYQDTWDRGAEEIGSITASEEEKQDILDFLADVNFPPAEEIAFTVDFELGMNEPFVFFGFDDEGLTVKAPASDGMGYRYYRALYQEDAYDQLYSLKEYIGEMRLGYYIEG